MQYKIKVRASSYKGKFRFTIPAKECREISATTNNYIKINLKKGKYVTYYYARIPSIPKSRTNLQVKRTVPKEFVEKARIKKNDLIDLQISLVENKRSTKLIQNDRFDILAAIPEKTKSGRPIMVDLIYKNNKNFCRIWYCSGQGGNFKPIELKRFIRIDRKLGEFFGLMQAESRKGGNKFDFTNNLISEHKLFIKVAERFGVSRNLWRYQVFFNPKMPDEYIDNKVSIFKKSLNIKKKVAFTENKFLSSVAFSTYINCNILAEIMISFLLAMRLKIAEPIKEKNMSQNIKDFATGFLCKVLLGDGTVVFNKANKNLMIEISEANRYSQNNIASIFNHFNISVTIFKNKIRLPSNLEIYLWLLDNRAFEGHPNRKKLIRNFMKKSFFKYFYSRFKICNKYTKKEFSNKHSLTLGTSAMYLYRNSKNGLLIKKQDYYELSKIGVRMVNILKNAEQELNSAFTDCQGN